MTTNSRLAYSRLASLLNFGWEFLLLTIGAIISAIAVIVFEAPFQIAAVLNFYPVINLLTEPQR